MRHPMKLGSRIKLKLKPRKKSVSKIDESGDLYLCESIEKPIEFDDIGILHENINNPYKMDVKARRDRSIQYIE